MIDRNRDLLAMALVGYESQKAKIEATITDIRQQLGHRGPGRPKAEPDGARQIAPKKRTMSLSARRRIAAAQRARWAKLKKAQAKPVRAKRKLTAAGRRAIAAALKKRWAAVHKKAKGRAKSAS